MSILPSKMVQITDDVKLCLSCGLCCNGVLFTYGPLKQGDMELAADVGLEVYTPSQDSDRQALQQPCVCWDGKCTIYPNRPAICGSYRCHLLRRLDTGDIGLDKALEIVRRAKSLVDAINSRLGTGHVNETIWERVGQTLDIEPDKLSSIDYADKENSELLLIVGMLMATLKEFEPDNYVTDLHTMSETDPEPPTD